MGKRSYHKNEIKRIMYWKQQEIGQDFMFKYLRKHFAKYFNLKDAKKWDVNFK